MLNNHGKLLFKMIPNHFGLTVCFKYNLQCRSVGLNVIIEKITDNLISNKVFNSTHEPITVAGPTTHILTFIHGEDKYPRFKIIFTSNCVQCVSGLSHTFQMNSFTLSLNIFDNTGKSILP